MRRHAVIRRVNEKQDKTRHCVTSRRRGVLPPVLGVRGTLLQPHQGVTGGAQGQTSDAVAPLLLRAVTQTVDIKITSKRGKEFAQLHLKSVKATAIQSDGSRHSDHGFDVMRCD